MTETAKLPEPIKVIVLGHSGHGKTGALASLLAAGYNVRVLDLDNGARVLRELIVGPGSKYPKDSLSRLSVITLTEKMRVVSGRIVPASATVWNKATSALNRWIDPEGRDFGNIETWGPQDVLVIDTLSSLGTAAMNFHLSLNGALVKDATQNEWRRNIGAAQAHIEHMCQLLYDSNLKCNILVNAHVVWSKEDGTMPQEGEGGVALYGFPASVGRAIGPRIPRYFNDVLMIKKIGTTSQIYSGNQANIGLKSSSPLRVKTSYPLETGLAQYFADVRGGAAA